MKFLRLMLLVVVVCGSGCGRFAAQRMLQAPNSYPPWLAPQAPVTLEFSERLLTNFASEYLPIPSPAARLRYRVIPPGNYDFHWSNQIDEAGHQFNLSFRAKVSESAERASGWSSQPRGTVVLLHGYGVAGFSMLPWAFLLAQDGWRCVVVDLRGHGKSTGKAIYFGLQEVQDLKALLDQLHEEEGVELPVNVVGHSFGAVLALRWKMLDSRVDKVVAMCPYAELPRAVLNVADQYAPWVPKGFLRAGLHVLPHVLHVRPEALDPVLWMKEQPVSALFIAGAQDRIAPPAEVKRLFALADPDSEFLLIDAPHEPLPYFFDKLALPVESWLQRQ